VSLCEAGVNGASGPFLARTPVEMSDWSRGRRRDGARIGLVPTMGALHPGHIELIRSSQRLADVTVVSIFVNPMQFDRGDDFDRYPRPIESDLTTCADLDVAAVYAPLASTMYPPGFQTTVSVGALSSVMEGAARPGHFDGVSTVVTKLFAAVRPDLAIFGEKDFQQLAIVRQMAADLDLGVDVVGHPIVREPDGLAMSSRNTRLDAEQRAAASIIPTALDEAVRAMRSGERSTAEVSSLVRRTIDREPSVRLEYVEVFDAITLAPVLEIEPNAPRPGHLRIAVAAFVGDVRLIDNRDPFGD
jgi:pantoate--beta-alanine ligase